MSNSKTIFVAGFFAFIILNFIENIIHYSLGRSHQKTFTVKLPSNGDFLKLTLIMFVFAILQGFLTELIDKYETN
jgi:hypothetical protein